MQLSWLEAVTCNKNALFLRPDINISCFTCFKCAPNMHINMQNFPI